MMITIADLQKEVSSTELQQLSDINAQGTVDELIIDDAINDAIAFIGSFIAIPSDPTPYLRSVAVELTLYELRKLHHLQDDEVKKSCEEKLIRMARGTVPTTLTQESEPRRTGNAYRHGRTRMSFEGF
jgi:phage gp36-like protein